MLNARPLWNGYNRRKQIVRFRAITAPERTRGYRLDGDTDLEANGDELDGMAGAEDEW
jgi:hypothetical protein